MINENKINVANIENGGVIIYLVLSSNNIKLDFSKDNFFAASIPCRLDNTSNSDILINNIPVKGDYFKMIQNTFNLIENYYEKHNDVLVLIKIITDNLNYDDALILASMFPKNNKEIILTQPFNRIYFSYKNIKTIYKELVSSSKCYKIDESNNLINTCLIRKCDHYSIFTFCLICDTMQDLISNHLTLLSQYAEPGVLFSHKCVDKNCIHGLKDKKITNRITLELNELGKINLNVTLTENKILLDVNSKRSIRQIIAEKYKLTPKSFFVDHIVKILIKNESLGHINQTFLNELFINRENKIQNWCSNFESSLINSNPINPVITDNMLVYYQVSEQNKYVHGRIGQFFYTHYIHELFRAANIFLIEINNALNKSLKMNEIIIYGGSIFSVLSGTSINDYDIALKNKLTDDEMFRFINALEMKYKQKSLLFVDSKTNKIKIEINNRLYDFNNSRNNNMFSKYYPSNIYIEFNNHGVSRIICCHKTFEYINSGKIDISNYFNNDIKICKYLSKGFIPECCENDIELEYVVSNLIMNKINNNNFNK
jgi:hypothetical protein